MFPTLAAALVLALAPTQTAPTQTATVRVPVANVWEAPNAGHLPLDPHVWPTPQVTYAQRIALVGHMPTQVLYGETVWVLERRSGWARLFVPDQPSPLDARGYPGWVRSWQLGPQLKAPLVVTAKSAKLPNGTEVGFGSQVAAGAVLASATRPLPHTRADIVRSAEQFLGLHYLWGGLSAWGYDCSGLTWAVYRAHGITIPRDADAQFAAGTPVALAQVRPGDLLFYESPVVGHVSMAIGNGQMIESPNSRSEVRIVPIRTSDFRGARRFF
ncbi:MAG: gamma-D-glutamyl-L-lysine dipeptidyl-peptidase [Gaiellaceae bacterium]|nr:gamma-D-glutamyl-L-lysine dipeptidyl-peptidase [Gaiellaceae bacterium]